MDPRLLTTKEAAAYLSLSPNSLKKHGPAPVRIGGSLRYDRHALDAWIDALGGGKTQVADPVAVAEAAALRALED